MIGKSLGIYSAWGVRYGTCCTTTAVLVRALEHSNCGKENEREKGIGG